MKRWFSALVVVVIAWAVAGLRAGHPLVVAGENMLSNPGFEATGGGGWEESGGLFEIVTAPHPVHTGNQAAQHQDSASDRDKWLEYGVYVEPGVTYRLGAWVYAPGAGPVVSRAYLAVEWHDSVGCAGAHLGVNVGDSLRSPPAGVWRELSGAVTAPAEARCAVLRLAFEPPAGQDPTLYWDDAFWGREDVATATPTTMPSPGPTASATATPAPSSTPTATASPAPSSTPSATATTGSTPPANGVVLNEFMAHPLTGDEYVELYNGNGFPVDLEGWLIDDGLDGGGLRLPAGSVLPAWGHAVWTGNFRLNNDGDTVRLFASDGALRDEFTYKQDPGPGVSWARSPDGGSEWRTDLAPSPGEPNPALPTATATATRTPSPTNTATPAPLSTAVVLNEVMIQPGSDWNGDGTADAGDEYVELFNRGPVAVDLAGWHLDDGLDGGSYTFPAGTTLEPAGFLVVVRRFGFNDADADMVRLLWPDGQPVSVLPYASAPGRDVAWARYPDGGAGWRNDLPPSPGRANPAPATATPTPTATATATQPPSGIVLNEYLPRPETGDEYVELYNTRPSEADISGWWVDDIEGGSSPHRLPAGSSIASHGYFVLAGSLGLNNEGDTVRLLAPDGTVRDSHAYTPAFAGIPWSRIEGAAGWSDRLPRTPGQPNLPARLTLSGTLYAGRPSAAGTGLAGHYIGLYGGDDPDSPERWLANAFTQRDGSYSLTFETNTALYRFYTLRPSPLAGYAWTGAASSHGAAHPPDRIRFGGLGTGVYPGNVFWMAPGATPTPTATVTVTATVTPTAGATAAATPVGAGFIVINEYLPAPRSADFNADGRVDSDDEYVELFNPQQTDVELGGWLLDDSTGGTRPFVLPAGTVLAPGGFLVLFGSQTGVGLNNEGDNVRLLAPDGLTEVDLAVYTRSRADAAWSRTVDGAGDWTDLYPPSPGAPNLPPAPTATPTNDVATASPSPSPGAAVSPTASPTTIPADVLTPTLTATPSPTGTPTTTSTVPAPTPTSPPVGWITLNEVLPAPNRIDFNGDGLVTSEDEYVELFNPQSTVVDLGGWWLDDAEGGAKPFMLPAGVYIAPQGFLLLFHSQTGVTLNNDGDRVRLLAPGGLLEVDAMAYTIGHGDKAWSRTMDGAGVWTETYPPSPGGPNIGPTTTPTATSTPTPTQTPSPTPTLAPGVVFLNEVLPAPRDTDWDGDGAADFQDEWIELYNGGDTPADLSAWRLWRGPLGDNGLPSGFYYRFPTGIRMPARSYLVIFHQQSQLSLPNGGDALYLVRPDGRLFDSFTWTQSPGYDRSFSRYPDGTGTWGTGAVTPGQPNLPLPEPPPESPNRPTPAAETGLGVGIESIARAYELAPGVRVTVEGQITAPPGLFGSHIAYVQDAASGLRLYLRGDGYPELVLGDRVRVTGRLSLFYGQRELNVSSARWLVRLGPGPAPRPRFLRTGLIGLPQEGRLVLVAGSVTGFRGNTFWLDDGSGEVQVTVDPDLPWRRPFFDAGSMWAVAGLVAQSEGRYRLLPRYPDDISPPPSRLPVTGSSGLTSRDSRP